MIFYFPNIAFVGLINLIVHVSCDISSHVNYQPIKYSQIQLALRYTSATGSIDSKQDISSQNPLITILHTRKDVIVSGRLLVASSEGSSRNSNETRTGKLDSKYESGCSKITTVSEVQWIAVVTNSGTCTTKQKLTNVLLGSNASALIIIENTHRSSEKYDFSSVGLQLSDFSIPISVLRNESIFINASIYINNFVVDGLISRTSVLFVSISFILLMIISLVWLTFYYIQRFRYMHAKERLSRRLANAAKKALSKIPTKVLATDDKEVLYDYDQCAICIDNYQVGETIRILPCKHIFHKICIDSWLIEQRSCPMCKVDILKACGIIGVTSNKISHNRPNPLLEAGLISSDPETGDSSTFDAVETNMNASSRCQRGQSSFLQRYRDRYGLHHYYQGHIKNHCHKYEHYHRKCIRHCANRRDKLNQSVEIDVEVNSMLQKNTVPNIDTERADLISESENSIASLNQTSFHLQNSKEDSKNSQQLTVNNEDLHEISHGLICDICECNSDNRPSDCDICGSLPNQSSSTSCSCESCDCYILERECGHYNENRTNSSGIGNLLGCCVSSGVERSNQNNRNNPERPISDSCCCNPCSECRNRYLRNPHFGNQFDKSHKNFKNCSSKSRCSMSTKDSHNSMVTHHTDNLINVNQFTKTTCTKPYLPNIGNRKNVYENRKQLKSIQLTKNLNKCATIDSYTKSSLSDEFDYEADGGSSSLEISIPVVKLTVLPPQVQYHQGSPNSDTSHSSSKTAEINMLESFPKSEEYQESEHSKTDSVIQDSPDHS